MNFLPYQRLKIITDLSSESIMNRLEEKVGLKKFKNFSRVDKNVFGGRIGHQEFDLKLHTSYRNSWSPEVHGKINDSKTKTQIELILKPNIFVILFTAFFMLIGVMLTINELKNLLYGGSFELFVLPFLIFPYALCWFGFNLDAEKVINHLLKISQGKIT